jgi:hypothetical protein
MDTRRVTPPTRDDLQKRIDAANEERQRYFTAQNFVETSRWDGKLEILKEWLASLAALLLIFTPGGALAQDIDSTPYKDEARAAGEPSTIPAGFAVDFAPATYVESPQFRHDWLESSANTTTCNGKRSLPWLGNSNTRTITTQIRHLLLNVEPFKSRKDPNFVFVPFAASGYTADRFAANTGNIWQSAAAAIVQYGGALCSVNEIVIGLTQMNPIAPSFVLTSTQLDQILDHVKTFIGPTVARVTIHSMNSTYQTRSGLAPGWSVAHDDEVLAAYAGRRQRGLLVRYVPLYSDGQTPHPVTGLTTETADTVDDAIHPSPTGADKFARYLWNLFYVDPSKWWMFAGHAPPVVDDPPPPPPPVYGTLDGAIRELADGVCSVIWGALRLPAPGWCGDL